MCKVTDRTDSDLVSLSDSFTDYDISYDIASAQSVTAAAASDTVWDRQS